MFDTRTYGYLSQASNIKENRRDIVHYCWGELEQEDISDRMAYIWVKTIVGALLAVNFAVPLYTVVSNRHLWDEPMAVLAGNMSLACAMDGLAIMLIGIYDLIKLDINGLCRSLQYLGFGFGIAFKAGQLCMAVDQYVAVFHALRHFPIMERARPWLFGATWLTWIMQIIFGIFANIFDLETFADSTIDSTNATLVFPECRWESALANVYTMVFEVQLVSFSLATAGLLIYTGVTGHRIKKKLIRAQKQRNSMFGDDDNQKFFDNFRAFKKIIAVLSLTVVMDIVAPINRFANRWYPMPQLAGFLHQVRLLAFIFEGWAYGLLNAKLRAAYKKTLCGTCCNHPDTHAVSPEIQSHPKHQKSVYAINVITPIELCPAQPEI